MGNQLSREKYFKENDINPYKILGVKKNIITSDKKESKKNIKKAYHIKAKELHPDKTQGSTELEFKILKECYQYLIDQLDNQGKSHIELKTSFNDNKQEYSYDSSRDFKKTNFDDYNVRKKLFVNTVDNSNYKNKSENIPTDYSSIPTTNYRNIFDSQKFNLQSFNAMFEIHGSKDSLLYNNDSCVEPESIISESTMNPVEISTYNGLLLEKEEENSFAFADEPTIIPTINETPSNKLDKLIKQQTIKAYSKKKLNNLYHERSNEKFNVDTSRSFAENELFLREQHINNMKKEMELNRQNINRHINIFPDSLIEQYHTNQLDDSSTVILN